MPLPYGYKLLPGPPTAPPPNGVTYAPGLNGQWYSYPAPGQDNSLLGTASAAGSNGAGADTGYQAPTTGVLGFTAWVDRNVPFLAAMDDATDLNPNTSGSLTASNGPIAGASAALAYISDIPRVLTTVIGLILIIAGIFALAKGPAVQVIGNAVRNAATS